MTLARERFLEALLASAIDYAIIALDLDGRVTIWNEGAQRILGWPAEEMLGQPASLFFTIEDRQRGVPQAEMQAALLHGRGNDERWHQRQDGSRFWASGEMMPLRDETGDVQGFLKILRDRTEQRRAAAALHEVQSLNTLILNSSRDCIVVLDLDGHTLFVSPGGVESMEIDDVGAIIGLSWLRVWTGADHDAARAAVAAARGGGTGRFQGFCPTHKGTPKWWDVVISPLPGPDGAPARLVSVGRDISELKQAEIRQIALLDLGDRLRDMADPAEMAFAAAEIMGRTLGASRAAYASVDAARETLTIARDWTAPGSASLAGTHLFRGSGSYIEDLKRGDIVVVGDAEQDARTTAHAAVLQSADARSLINVPIFEHGALVAVFFINHAQPRIWTVDDIRFVGGVADRARAEIERRDAEHRLRAFAASLEQQVAERTADRNRLWQLSTDIMVVARFDGIIVAINPAWTSVLGWTDQDLVGISLVSLLHPDDLERTIAGTKGLLEGARISRFDNRYRHKDGSYRWFAWNAVSGEGLISGVGRDFTAEKERADALSAAEEQLRQSQKMEAVGQLTGGIAHDFNNLLTAIIGSVEMMQTRIDRGIGAELARYVGIARDAAQRASALTHRLLAFSRRQTLDPKPVAVDRLIDGMAEIIRRSMGPAIRVDLAGGADLWTVLCDPNQLENALLNLCINARDAMPDGGRLTIETANADLDQYAARMRDVTPGRYVALSVTDTGTGMLPEVIARAFDPFFTTKPLGQGTGLGLSMVYGFAKQSGGQVKIYSQQGQGSTVRIYLPRHDGAAELLANHDSFAAAGRAGADETVLIVDDEPTIRMLVVEVLHDLGYAAIEAVDGAAGLLVLQSPARVDLLLTDVGLPGGINGRQLADAARVLRPELKVLFITGYAENAAIGNGHVPPGMQVMTKPFAMEALAARIRAMLGASGT